MPISSDGIILLAKQSGITSFSSLWQIKNALGTKKIGHTGTLDTFAEGLLVVLSGRLTRLCSFITDCDKEYEALISFGTETDTLDPDGLPIANAPLPTLESILKVLPLYRGDIQQRPPVYSAVHVDGQRASDRIRNGETIELPPRPVTIHVFEIVTITTFNGLSAEPTSLVSSLIVRIVCSKGTYIRSLARDLAISSGSRAHLAALRRNRIGPFSLDEAAGISLLSPFGTVLPSVYGVGDKPPQASAEEIKKTVKSFDSTMASFVGLPPVFLDPSYLADFNNGKIPSASWFTGNTASTNLYQKFSVFCNERFAGVISFKDGNPLYEFVAGRES